jgi:lipopolysaccharide/colanic/teichoic acid biosynthesis glycosyltransferase
VLTPDEAAATSSGQQPLRELVEAGEANVVVLDRAAQLDRTIVEQVATMHERGLRVRTLSLFYEEWLGKLPVSELERISLMFDIGEVHRLRYGRFKRVVDIAIAAVGLVPLAVITPVVLLGNMLGNRGPLLFRQERVGKNGAPITMLKFRTMSDRASGAGRWTEASDPRVTPFGRYLRRSHVDELPQMWNILRGDLSVVGPRPEQPQYVAELSEKLPFYNLRHLVRPGLTGWAQVKYGYASTDADALEKLQYEFYYLRHQRLSLDLRIVARTTRSVLRSEGH